VQKIRRLFSGSKVVQEELRFIRADGSLLYGETIGAALYDAVGRLFAVTNVVRDITERKKREAQLLLMASVIEQSDSNIILTDSNGTIQYANTFFERTSGYCRDEILSFHLNTLFQEPKEENIPSIHNTFSQGSGWKGRIKGKRKNGSLYETDLTITPIHDPKGIITNFASFSRDVTRECEMEHYFRQVQKREALGTLAGGIAHEFNNIFGAIIGYTEIGLYKLPEGSRTHDNLKQVFAVCLRARDLIKQILAFSSQSDQERSIIRIHPILQEALNFFRATLPSTIAVRYECKTDKDFVKANSNEILQIVLNICNNASWAMKGKLGFLEILLEDNVPTAENGPQLRSLPPGPYLRLTIRDTGPGIDQKIIDRIFDPFFTTKEVGEGTGMGLAVVQGIVESLGGTTRVESTPGEGTAFRVYLPQSQGQDPIPIFPKPPLPEKGRILFVEDEVSLAEQGHQMLSRLGYDVVSQTSSLEALKEFQARPDYFDLVITDQTMPEMTGVMLARGILAVRPDIPIILSSEYCEGITAQEAEAAGIKALVIKPLILDVISRLIHSLLPKEAAGSAQWE
ncbi:MAG: PAS domain S-box protein, partial [Deltaproteobacteria bacterium]|nr:PAS domain S-box protein [Deltaproteobacteria bacterium]